MIILDMEGKIVCAIQRKDIEADSGHKLPVIDLLLVPHSLRDDFEACHFAERCRKNLKSERCIFYV